MNRLILLIGCVAAAVSLALPAWMLARWFRDSGIRPFRAFERFVPRSAVERLILVCVAVGFFHYGATKETNAPPRGGAECKVESVELRSGQSYNSALSTFNSQFRLEFVATNDSYSYVRPSNGVRYANWWRRGAYEDVFRLDLGGMSFPFGTNLCDSLWVYTWGMAGARLGDASNRLVATGAPMSAVPGLSQFWNAATPIGGRLLTWENFFLNRDTNTPVSAQLELMPSGDVIVRSNLVESVYRRVNPDDWDDDGIPNDEDLDPLVYNGDFFGPHQQLPNGANTNHYYWVDVVVSKANARITFEGDGYSHLPDPVFIARAGDTNRVMLLLGKPYVIHCSMPIYVIDKEDDEVGVSVCGGNLNVVWPIQVSFVPLMRGGCATTATVMPQRANGGNFSWPDNFCCYSLAAGVIPVFDCDGTCGCGGCSTGDITYEVGGHGISFGGVHCGCQHEGEHVGGDEPGLGGNDPSEQSSGPSVFVSFSKSAIVFEEEYTNTINDIVQRRSTDSELTCEVYGGTNGGHYVFALYDGGRLARKSGSYLPRSGTVKAGETFRIKIRYEALAASAEDGDISAVGTFTENKTGTDLVSEAALTSVQVEVRPIVGRDGCENRHRMGVRELFQVITQPSSAQCLIQCSQDWTMTSSSPITCQCPILAGANGIVMNIAGENYTPSLTVVEPTGVVCPKGWSQCATGYTAMLLDPYITPLDVSFQGIAVMEVPTTSVGPSGYFTNEVFSSVWYHTHFRGAGQWHNVGLENFFFRDTPAFAEICPQPFADGTIDWEIVLGWGELNSPTNIPPVKMIASHYHQVFTIDVQGGIRIDKFGQWIKQFPDGTITNSPGIIRTEGAQ